MLTDGPRPLNPGNGSCKATQNRLIPASRRPEERGASSQGRETRSPGRFPNEGSKTNAQRRGGRTGGGPRRPGSGDSSLLTVCASTSGPLCTPSLTEAGTVPGAGSPGGRDKAARTWGPEQEKVSLTRTPGPPLSSCTVPCRRSWPGKPGAAPSQDPRPRYAGKARISEHRSSREMATFSLERGTDDHEIGVVPGDRPAWDNHSF